MRPILFEIFDKQIPSYEFFVSLGFLVGIIIFFIESKKKLSGENSYILFLSGLAGGIIGAKLPIFVYYFKKIVARHFELQSLLSGRTIVGGIIGGWIAIEIAKKAIGIKQKTGDAFAIAICAGEAIGRIGCFLKGCCLGIRTNLPWGMNFGDGITRHPTQIYSILFNLILLAYLLRLRSSKPKDGVIFERFLIIYFSFRFLIEFIRATPTVFIGLSGFQFAALGVVFYTIFNKYRTNEPENPKLSATE